MIDPYMEMKWIEYCERCYAMGLDDEDTIIQRPGFLAGVAIGANMVSKRVGGECQHPPAVAWAVKDIIRGVNDALESMAREGGVGD